MGSAVGTGSTFSFSAGRHPLLEYIASRRAVSLEPLGLAADPWSIAP